MMGTLLGVIAFGIAMFLIVVLVVSPFLPH